MAATVTITFGGVVMKLFRKDYLSMVSHQPGIFETIVSMCITQGKKSPNGSRYCYPQQKKLGDWNGVCRKTANEAVGYYEKNGFFNTQVRRPRKGKFRTLLYYLGPTTLRAMGCATAAAQALLHRVTSKLHISKKYTPIKEGFKEKSTFNVKINSPPLEEYLLSLGRKLGFVK